ncbi:dihydrofolate reductase family protein [Aggregatilinea lenta]|uniref:dihydrofolate reductase family protein n=1 Tax=Aggregatilinea lenta TaxID=913108 RepID=UPI000E5A75DC|nr:dihydrofolate reductase family protein [Aggregatilinea lenta]
MAKVIGGMTLSLDGFVAEPDGNIDRLYPDMDALHASEVLQEEIRTTGAIVMGRHSYDMADPDWFADDYEYQVPIFVLTHHVPEKKPKENDALTVTFVTEGIESAIAQAKAAAGDRNVLLIGASMNQQCLNAGLCDELHIGIMPVLFGIGPRLFEHLQMPDHITLEKIRIFEAGERTDLWYRIVH